MRIKRILPAGIIAGGALLAATAFTLQSGNNKPFPVPAYQVARVIDGDTFETTEKQLIRLTAIKAPENGLCGSTEAKKALEKLVLKKPIYLKVVYRDSYDRLISIVYNDKELVNAAMLKGGFAYYEGNPAGFNDELSKASAEAITSGRGIHGSPCTQEVNVQQPSCSIKGNIGKEHVYYTDGCYQYKNAVVELYKGDQWFCTEAEAQKAGFRKAKQCN